jgi:hypothetical protein
VGEDGVWDRLKKLVKGVLGDDEPERQPLVIESSDPKMRALFDTPFVRDTLTQLFSDTAHVTEYETERPTRTLGSTDIMSPDSIKVRDMEEPVYRAVGANPESTLFHELIHRNELKNRWKRDLTDVFPDTARVREIRTRKWLTPQMQRYLGPNELIENVVKRNNLADNLESTAYAYQEAMDSLRTPGFQPSPTTNWMHPGANIAFHDLKRRIR